MPKRAHLVAGVIATLCVATFFVSTVLVELLGSHETVAWLKSLVVMPGLFVLVPAIAITGGSGLFLSKSRRGRLVDAKKKRMPLIAANRVARAGAFRHRAEPMVGRGLVSTHPSTWCRRLNCWPARSTCRSWR